MPWGANTARWREKGVIEWMKAAKNTEETHRRFGAGVLALLMAFTLFGGTRAFASGSGRTAMEVDQLPEKLIPVGHTVGIKLFSEGVLVVGLSEVETAAGSCSPAKDCGLKVGDVILQANGTAVESTEQFQSMMTGSGGKTVSLSVQRGERTFVLEAKGVEGSDGTVKLGAWIRDSLAGIGTMTFYDPENGVFGTLGHGINDTDTNLLMPLNVGAIMYSSVKAVKPGAAGDPGELRGEFDLTEDLGALYANTARGVFGTMEDTCSLLDGKEAVEIAQPSEVEVGPAAILSNISGDTVASYEVEIEKICNPDGPSQNFIVRVTDERLLAATGGIVQGMSGSPILQNGKLIGAVTHVMVNDPQRGYGIFISNMLQDGYSISTKKAS